MNYPNFKEEKKLWKQGFNVVVGLDEAGRGPLAGPVAAAAVVVRPEHSVLLSARRDAKIFIKNFGIRDSKQLSEKKREELYEVLVNHPAIEWGIGVVSEKVIDKINILEATKLAMLEAAENLQADFLLLDGNFKINSKISQKSIIKGDQKVFSISAASIIAKVTRDRIMQKMHKKYPKYNFAAHKGYGTALHIKNLQNFGPCKIHRKTFFPVNTLV
ncbi:MAG: ribonuclease HII [Candidatus Staskawiczbacteria bacterium RIFCSPHIGHO2_12_FULL_38_11]|uniref:Ribonuclease HII n=1 Tax=Candidatus Staskawiczbacteria bacterium RIFCSPHIGHO2_12_FULL_38_11 TaxID=1802209 RepID=A0A1G2I6V6_9BACT|nr:MAG: ribonuclease HII [Candidatus Staskawiczbacteria bacterium RIFCSPHIGHO2_12_FULL_38_11]